MGTRNIMGDVRDSVGIRNIAMNTRNDGVGGRNTRENVGVGHKCVYLEFGLEV